MPRIVGTLLIQNTEIIPQGGALSSGVGSGLVIPTSIDGGSVTIGVIAATIDTDSNISFDAGGVN